MYTTERCPFCVMAKRLLAAEGAEFEEVSVDERRDLRDWLVEASAQATVPQIFINGDSIGGFQELAGLKRAGVLTERLAVAPSDANASLQR